MRVLQLCHRIPYPPADGGSIAMHQITQGLLNEGVDVKVMALSPRSLETNRHTIPEEYLNTTGFESISIDTRVKLLPAILNLFTNESYNIKRFRSKAMRQSLKRVLTDNQFDIIQMEGLYLTPYLDLVRNLSSAAVIYRSHNIEHFIWQRLAWSSRNPIKRTYLRLLASRLEIYERTVIDQVDGLVAISEVDRDFFVKAGYNGPSIVIPAGMPDFQLPDCIPEPEPGTVFHLGSMDWRPNQEGVIWLLKKVWPLVTCQRPELVLHIAGRRMPAYFHQFSSENVVVAGEVDEAMAFILSKNIMVVPLLSGGGMRIKIIEGMAAGKTIISTSIGAEGIGCTHQENIILADTPEGMAHWIIKCNDNTILAADIGKKAREFVEKYYNNQNIIKDLILFYHTFSTG